MTILGILNIIYLNINPRVAQILVAVGFTVLAGCADFDLKSAAIAEKDKVVLLHGLGRSESAMGSLATKLEQANYEVHRIGYNSMHNSPKQIMDEVTPKILECCYKDDRTVHFVGHSLGGLIIRSFLENNRRQQTGNTVLIGTPNNGSEIVDKYKDRWWMKNAGPTALSLGTQQDSFPNSLGPPYYPLGVIAGKSNNQISNSMIPGDDDGIVSVESTKVPGMTDFIVIETSHTQMRYNELVAQQVIQFLRYGAFFRSALQPFK